MDFSSRHILFPPQSFPSDVPALSDIFPHFPSEQKKVLFVFRKLCFLFPKTAVLLSERILIYFSDFFFCSSKFFTTAVILSFSARISCNFC